MLLILIACEFLRYHDKQKISTISFIWEIIKSVRFCLSLRLQVKTVTSNVIEKVINSIDVL